MPDLLGRSVYLTGFEEQKAPLAAFAAGGAPVFLSLHISEEFAPDYCARAQAACDWLHAQGYRILADVSPKTAAQFGQPDLAALAERLHLWALRIDYGFTLPQVCALAARLPVVLNASTTTPAQAAQVAAAGSLVMAMHNFYPRPETGLDEEFLAESTRALQAAGLKVLGFVPGDGARRGPLHEGLPTLEAHRAAAPSAAFADLALRFGLDGIFVGDPGLSQAEARRILHFCRTGQLLVPAQLRPAYAGLYGQPFTCRPDSPRWLVRFTESRQYASRGGAVQPDNTVARPRGALTMDNLRYGRYSGEVQLVRQPLPADPRVNVIGQVSEAHLLLADRIARGAAFALVQP